MPTLHVSDETEQSKPLFLVSGSTRHVTKSFISSLINDFKLIILNNPRKYPADANIFQVYNSAVGTIKKLSEKIDYAVFFLNTLEDKKILEQLIPKIEMDSPRVIIVFPVDKFTEFSDVLLLGKQIPSISFALVGDLFGSDIPPDVSRMSKVVYAATTQKSADFISSELVSIFPISEVDILKGLPYLLFSHEKRDRVFFFFYEHPQTIISAIHLLKRLEPDLQILTSSQSSEYSPRIAHRDLEKSIFAKSHLKAIYLDDIFDGFEHSVRSVTYSKQVPFTGKRHSSRKKRSLPVSKSFSQTAATVLTCALLLFLIFNVLLTISGIVFGKGAIKSLKQGELQKAGNQLAIATTSFELSKPVVTLGFEILQKLPIPAIAQSYQFFTSGVNLTALVAQQLTTASQIQTGLTQSELLESLATVSYLYFASQSSPTYARLPYLDKLSETSTSNILATLPVIPDLLGYGSEKRYLLLFQNNGELRPTGGFIGSVGDLKLKNGRVEEFTIQDVYDIDGQIKTHTEPPYIVRRYLQPHLYLRDSNFALDFQEAATTAAQLYKEGSGNTVDGVIGVDYEVLKKVIEVTGPLHLPTYNQTIDAKTGFEFIQTTIESTFSPGNSQKKSILSEVFSQLLFKLESTRNVLLVAQILPSLIEQKHILFAFKDPALQEIFTVQKYAGAITPLGISNSHTFFDFFAINEANIGVNKANIFVTRSLSLSQTLIEDSLTSHATVTLDNTRGKEQYKVYIRFISAAESKFEELSINGTITPTVPAITTPRLYEAASFTAPQRTELTEEQYQDKKVFGFVHTVLPGKKDILAVHYSRDIIVPDESFEYRFIFQPQPGTTNTPFSYSISFPEEFIAHNEQSGTTAQKKFSTTQLGTQDIFISLPFEKRSIE